MTLKAICNQISSINLNPVLGKKSFYIGLALAAIGGLGHVLNRRRKPVDQAGNLDQRVHQTPKRRAIRYTATALMILGGLIAALSARNAFKAAQTMPMMPLKPAAEYDLPGLYNDWNNINRA